MNLPEASETTSSAFDVLNKTRNKGELSVASTVGTLETILVVGCRVEMCIQGTQLLELPATKVAFKGRSCECLFRRNVVDARLHTVHRVCGSSEQPRGRDSWDDLHVVNGSSNVVTSDTPLAGA